jgi:hypothetical protein
MVGDLNANQAANPLRKGEKKRKRKRIITSSKTVELQALLVVLLHL